MRIFYFLVMYLIEKIGRITDSIHLISTLRKHLFFHNLLCRMIEFLLNYKNCFNFIQQNSFAPISGGWMQNYLSDSVGFKTRLNEVRPSADATDFLMEIYRASSGKIRAQIRRGEFDFVLI